MELTPLTHLYLQCICHPTCQKALVFGHIFCVKSLKVHKLKAPFSCFLEMLPPIFGQMCMLSPKYPYCLLVPSLRLLRVHGYQPYPIINTTLPAYIMYNIQAVPKKSWCPPVDQCIFYSSNKYNAILFLNNLISS